MAELGQDRAAFAQVVMALRPYLGELVFVGGWAHRLHALHELASRLALRRIPGAAVGRHHPPRRLA